MWRFVLRENIRRFEALMGLAKSEDQRETLLELLQEARSQLDELENASTPEIAKRDDWLNTLANRAVDQAMALQHAQFASLQIYEESSEHLIILAQRNLRAAFLHHLAQVKPGDGSACGRCLANNAPVVIADVSRDSAFEPHRKAAHEAGFQAVEAFPVRDGSDKLVAVLSTYFESAHAISGDELDRMTDFANSVGRTLASHLGG